MKKSINFFSIMVGTLPNMKNIVILILCFIPSLIHAQEIKVYEGELYLHKTIHQSVVNKHYDCSFRSEFSGRGKYHYYESDGKRVLHGDYFYQRENCYLKGAFKHGNMDGVWELGFNNKNYIGIVPPFYQRFTYKDGEICGSFEIYHSLVKSLCSSPDGNWDIWDISSYKRIRAEIKDSIFVGTYLGETIHADYKKSHTGQFDKNGWATGNWINKFEGKNRSGVIETKEYEKGVLQRTTLYQDWLGETEVKYENMDEILNINGQEIVLNNSKNIGVYNSQYYNYEDGYDILLVREPWSGDDCITRMKLRNYPFRVFSYDQNAAYIYDSYCKEIERERYINQYTESVKDKVFHLPYGVYPKWGFDDIVQEISRKFEKRLKGIVKCEVIVNAEGIITEITELKVYDCKKSEIVENLMWKELPEKILGMKVDQYFHAIPAPTKPSSGYSNREESDTWPEIKIPVNYKVCCFYPFDSKK